MLKPPASAEIASSRHRSRKCWKCYQTWLSKYRSFTRRKFSKLPEKTPSSSEMRCREERFDNQIELCVRRIHKKRQDAGYTDGCTASCTRKSMNELYGSDHCPENRMSLNRSWRVSGNVKCVRVQPDFPKENVTSIDSTPGALSTRGLRRRACASPL